MELTAGGCLPTFTSASSSTITQPSLRLNCVTRLKGVAESPPSPPHPEPSYAQLNWKEAKFWTGSSLQLSLSPTVSTSLSLSLTFSPTSPPVSHTAAIVPSALELHGSWALGGCRGEQGAAFLWGGGGENEGVAPKRLMQHKWKHRSEWSKRSRS